MQKQLFSRNTLFIGLCRNVRLRTHNALPVASYSSNAEDKDLLHRSVMPTEHFQRSLPRLKIPPLEHTCEKYLQSQLPLLTPKQHGETKKIVEEFKNGDGKDLHEELVAQDKRNKHTSYISEPWFDMYLRDRRAVALNHNPFMAFNDDPNTEYNNQLTRATNMVVSSMRFLKTYRAKVLEPEIFHLQPQKTDTDKFKRFLSWIPEAVAFYGAAIYQAFPLDMSQYPKLFNSSRIPRPEKDELFSDFSATHMLVLRKGHFYTFEAFDKDGNILPADVIQANLQYILNDNTPPAEYPIGIFTSQNRDLWTDMRNKLISAGNTEALSKIDSALFALALDDDDTEDPVKLSKLFLHGDGTNRWFDKSFSLIMAKSGKACVNFEHAWGDGVAVLRYFNEVFKDTTQKPQVHPGSPSAQIDPSQTVTKLEFTLTDEIKQSITESKQKFKKLTDNLELSFHKHEKFGKDFLKSQKFSPDAFMQLAIQMAYTRMAGKTAASYESCSTAAFKHGRTETIRPATTATHNACQMTHPLNTTSTVQEMKKAMDVCSEIHTMNTREAAMGRGFDRHLFSIKYLAQKLGRPLPKLYEDPAYSKMNHVILSTSTLTSPAVLIGGFAPVVPDGYGIGYGIDKSNLGCVVTTYSDACSSNDFIEGFKDAVDDLHDILLGQDFRQNYK